MSDEREMTAEGRNLVSEIDQLRRQKGGLREADIVARRALQAAHTAGRAEGLEEAAQWHIEQSRQLRARADERRYKGMRGVRTYETAADHHRNSADAIRARIAEPAPERESPACQLCKDNGGVFSFGSEGVHWDQQLPCAECGKTATWLAGRLAPQRGDGWRPASTAPKYGLRQRWHTSWECWITVEPTPKHLVDMGYMEWIEATKCNTWPERAFGPYWKPVDAAPPAAPAEPED